MPEHDNDERPTVRRILGNTLRRHRERAGWSLRELAEKTTFNHTYIGRVERAEQLPSDALARALDNTFDTGGSLLELLEVARQEVIRDYSREGVNKESKAARIQACSSSVVPGLLQTAGYARALFRSSRLGGADDGIEEAVTARMSRKLIFDREKPPLYWAILDESALRRPVGGAPCMKEQLEQLAEAALTPSITCQVLPFDAGEHPVLGGSLTLLTMQNGDTAAYVESFVSGELVEAPQRVLEVTQRFDVARSLALSPDDSLALIRKYAEGD